ncbi:MAG TPA: hypothetical protein VMZ00_03515 [Sporichthya sp.]|nr:hypothetical protein [Sporichthya sp.]
MPTDHERALEGLHTPPADVPLWSENFAWDGFDPVAGAGVLVHLGRSPVGPELWRSWAVAYLPGETLVVAKAVAPNAGGIGSGPLTLTCQQPMQRWGVRFRGAGRPTSRAELASGRIVDAEVVGLDIDLTFSAANPVWDVGAMHSLGETHYEQHGRWTGTITAADQTYPIDTTGYRDHSTGKRDIGGMGAHVWAHAVFPSGRAFSLLQVWTPDGRLATSEGAIIAGGMLADLAPDSTPALDDAFGSPGSGTITFPGCSPISVEVLHGVSLTLGQPNDFFFGYDAALGRKVLTDCPARMEWDGEVATGWLERSRTFAD